MKGEAVLSPKKPCSTTMRVVSIRGKSLVRRQCSLQALSYSTLLPVIYLKPERTYHFRRCHKKLNRENCTLVDKSKKSNELQWLE